MIYYIDPQNGLETNSGISPEQPRKDYRALKLVPGDTVLFCRNRVIRDTLDRVKGTADHPITYGSYGEGINPVFCATTDVRFRDKWVCVAPNIWKYTDNTLSEVHNVIFDYEKGCGTLRWEEQDLVSQGDWYDSCMGMKGEKGDDRRFLLYSIGNPADVYGRIECSVDSFRLISLNTEYTICQDLCFFGGLVAMAMGANHVTIRRCSFGYVGGRVWSRERRIRCGNAIEFWDFGEDILIENCYFDNIYDSCITHQGNHGSSQLAKNLVMQNNLFMHYGMGAYEARDRMLVNSSFTDNICVDAGGGFGAQGDTIPRKSEIYPQPMGHHVFLWRMDCAEDEGRFEISNNVFYDAQGAAIYSIIDPEAEKQLVLHGNRYQTYNTELLNSFSQKSYADFKSYQASGIENDASYGVEKEELQQMINNWFSVSGAQGPEFCKLI